MHVTGVASVTVLAVLLSTLPASAQTTDAAVADLRVRAEQGDAEAQFNLGLMYEQEPMESPSVAMPEEAGWSSDDSKDWYFGGGPSPQTAEEFVLAQSYISFGYGQSAADALQPYIDIRMAEFKRKLETDAAAVLMHVLGVRGYSQSYGLGCPTPSRKMTLKLCAGTGWPPRKETPWRRTISGSCTTMVEVSRKTMLKPCAGTGWPPRKGTPRRSSISGSCARMAAASRKTTCQRTCG